jgi:hypothetical protein
MRMLESRNDKFQGSHRMAPILRFWFSSVSFFLGDSVRSVAAVKSEGHFLFKRKKKQSYYYKEKAVVAQWSTLHTAVEPTQPSLISVHP